MVIMVVDAPRKSLGSCRSTNNNNNKNIFKAPNLVPRDYSKRVRARAHTHTHTHRGTGTHKHSDYTKLNIHSLKQAANAGGGPSDPQRVDRNSPSFTL